MKDIDYGKPACFYRIEAMLCVCKHPEANLIWTSLAAAYERAFYTLCAGETDGYAQNTTAWD